MIVNSSTINWNLTDEESQRAETNNKIIQFTTEQTVPRNYAFGCNVVLQFRGGTLICDRKIVLRIEKVSTEKIEYRLQYVWDYQRCILKHNAGSDYIAFNEISSNFPEEGKIRQPIFFFSGVNNVMAVRLIRIIQYQSKSTTESQTNTKISTQYVDIPLCGCTILYDNGTNVNGYRWKDSSSPILHCSNTTIVGVEFEGANVTCRASSSTTSSGTWQPGDMFVNTDNKSTNNWTVRVK